MQRDEVILALRQLEAMRLQVRRMEDALECLTECEREIIEKMMVEPTPGIGDKLCEILCVEIATVYRRRNKALKKLENFLSELR